MLAGQVQVATRQAQQQEVVLHSRAAGVLGALHIQVQGRRSQGARVRAGRRIRSRVRPWLNDYFAGRGCCSML